MSVIPCGRTVLGGVMALLLTASCAETPPPPTREHVVLTGDAYSRGLQHGQQLRSKVRSFYTTLLTSTLLPYLNREHTDIAAFLPEYQKERYQDGRFSREILLESARELERSIPREYRDEMRGIADGSGLSYDDVLLLNTFVDTTLSVRAVAAAIKLAQGPRLLSVEVVGAGTDGVDNDEDGAVDEAEEGLISPWEPSANASLSAVPRDAVIRFVLSDKDGVDPQTVRLEVGDLVFGAADEAVSVRTLEEPPGALEITFSPPAAVTTGDVLSVSLNAGDLAQSKSAPVHAYFMREERLTVTLAGSALTRAQVANAGPKRGRGQPTSIAFAVRGDVSADGAPLLAHNFALLDANTSHKHAAVFEHHPDGAAPFAVIGWAGIVWGFSGMNEAGLAVTCNHSDTLDNQVVARFIEQLGDLQNAKLLSRGRPMGFVLRRTLEDRRDVAAAEEEFRTATHPFGWTCVAADPSSALRVLEVDADVSGDGNTFSFAPEDQLSSVGPDDLFVAGHFVKNKDDMFELNVAGQRVAPQRYWSSHFPRSVQTYAALGRALRETPVVGVEEAKTLLGRPELADMRDGMSSAVFEPRARRFHVAIGAVPSASAGFETFSLGGEGE